MAKFAVGAENGVPIELHFTDHGEGQPVVLIHGWALSSRGWEAQVPALVGAGYRVITYDRRGFGQSSQPWHGYEYETLTADLAALLDHLDLTDAILIGFSMGGGEVVRYLSRFGADRVSKIVLASAVQPYLFKSDDNPEGGIDDAFLDGMIGEVTKDRMAFLDEFLTKYFSAGRKLKISPQQKVYALSLAAAAFPRATTESINAWGRTDFRSDLAAVTVPTLVIHGDSDNIVPIGVSGERTAEAIPGAVLVVLEDAPHGVTVSHPEEWNAAVLRFLSG
ncbi:MAG TPA: alpha/beta hydrolase [Propionibacteriaceae bacterium]|nr:alpha/beta hydrolase [Propionibacteriaceae bacterium]